MRLIWRVEAYWSRAMWRARASGQRAQGTDERGEARPTDEGNSSDDGSPRRRAGGSEWTNHRVFVSAGATILCECRGIK